MMLVETPPTLPQRTSSAQVKENSRLINYYDAIECLLQQVRGQGYYTTHFGIAPAAREDYCFVKACMLGDHYPEMVGFMSDAVSALHQRIFQNMPTPDSVLDVGCGTGGTLRRLAEYWPEATLEGININGGQLALAEGVLAACPNTRLHHGDFLTQRFPRQFQLTYFIESAFHMAPKARLFEQLAEVTAPGGEVAVVDIFWAENLPPRLARLTGPEGLFDYLNLQQWRDGLAQQGFEVVDFDDLSREVAHTIVINTAFEEFEQRVLLPSFTFPHNRDNLISGATDVYFGYRQLRRLLLKGYAHYGILRLRKVR